MARRFVSRRITAVAGTATLVLAAATALASPALAAPVSACSPYQLPGMAAGGYGEVMTMNNSGLYVGEVLDAAGVNNAAYWTHSGSSLTSGWNLTVPSLPLPNTEFLDVNSSGVMSGVSYDTGVGFVFDSRTRALTVLPPLPGGSGAWARRINSYGVVSGQAWDAVGNGYATIWKPPYASATRLHLPGEGQNYKYWDPNVGQYVHIKVGSETDGINDSGTVAGSTYLGGSVHDVAQWARSHQWRNYYAPLNQAITATENGHVVRLPAGYNEAFGFAINNAGLVVGGSLRDDNHGFLPAYWRDGVEHDMGAPANAVEGTAYNVSQGGWATGGLYFDDGQSSFVWTGAGSLQLNAPLPGHVDSWSHGVNDALSQVAGASYPDHTGPGVATVWQCPAGFSTS